MTLLLLVLGAFSLVAIFVFYYGPLVSNFQIARYRIVNGTDHVGPALEYGWTLITEAPSRHLRKRSLLHHQKS